MSKKKPNFKEASTTNVIVGYQDGGMFGALGKKKKKETPWYMKPSAELANMVRKSLGERRIMSVLGLLSEAIPVKDPPAQAPQKPEKRSTVKGKQLLKQTFPGLSLGNLPKALSQEITASSKDPENLTNDWRRWKSLSPDLLAKVSAFYKHKHKQHKQQKQQKKSSSKSVVSPKDRKELATLKKKKAKKLSRSGKSVDKDDPKNRTRDEKELFKNRGEYPTDAQSFLRTARTRLQKARSTLRKDATNASAQWEIKNFERQISAVEKAVAAGKKDWRTAIGAPAPPEIKPRDKPELRGMDDSELKRKALSLVPSKQRAATGKSEDSGRESTFGYIISKFRGKDPSDRAKIPQLVRQWAIDNSIQYEKIKKTKDGNFLLITKDQNNFKPGSFRSEEVGPGISKMRGELDASPYDRAYHRIRKFAGIEPVTQEEHSRIGVWLRDIIFKKHQGDLSAWALTQPQKKPRPKYAKGTEKGQMRVRGAGKRSGGTSTNKPGREARFRPDPMPGAIKGLKGLHKKMEKSAEHERIPFAPKPKGGTNPEHGAVGNILKKVYGELAAEYLYSGGEESGHGRGRFDDLVASIGKRYQINMQDTLNRYVELQSQNPDAESLSPEETAALRKNFTSQEHKALGELSTLSSPEAKSALKVNDMTKFEKVLGPYLRKIYHQKGNILKDPDDQLHYSEVMTKELSQRLGIPTDDVEQAMLEKDPAGRAKIEKSSLEAIKVFFPKDYEDEMAMFAKRSRGQSQNREGEASRRAKEEESRVDAQAEHGEDLYRKQRSSELAKSLGQSAIDNRAMKKAAERRHGSFSRDSRSEDDEGKLDYMRRKGLERQFSMAGDEDRYAAAKFDAAQQRLPKIVSDPGAGLDPEQLAQLGVPDDEAMGQAMRSAKRRAQKRAQKKTLIDLINQGKEKRMASNESIKFSIADLYEAFENSYELDADAPEKEWENGEVPAAKDWSRELTLESLLSALKKNK